MLTIMKTDHFCFSTTITFLLKENIVGMIRIQHFPIENEDIFHIMYQIKVSMVQLWIRYGGLIEITT